MISVTKAYIGMNRYLRARDQIKGIIIIIIVENIGRFSYLDYLEGES